MGKGSVKVATPNGWELNVAVIELASLSTMQGSGETLNTILSSPATQFAFGGALFYGIQRFFREVEEKLNEDTKLEIAIWLVGVRVGPAVEAWPVTFARVFDRVFGSKHLSFKCFFRSSVASYASIVLSLSVYSFSVGFPKLSMDEISAFGIAAIFMNVIPDYVSLLESRLCLRLMTTNHSFLPMMLLLSIDLVFTTIIAGIPFFAAYMGFEALVLGEIPVNVPFIAALWFFPAFFTSIWLWLYAGSGFLLKAAHRFDIGFDWFNRHFDIEKKPLQSIGLVAGAVCAFLYWAVVIAKRFAS